MAQHPARGTWGTRQLIRLLPSCWQSCFSGCWDSSSRTSSPCRGRIFDHSNENTSIRPWSRSSAKVADRIGELDRAIGDRRREQELVGDSSQNLQRTINQLLELQKLSIQKAIALSASDKDNLSASLKQFLESQKSYRN